MIDIDPQHLISVLSSQRNSAMDRAAKSEAVVLQLQQAVIDKAARIAELEAKFPPEVEQI